MFKYKVSNTDFEALDDTTKAFYKADPTGENYTLQVEGVADKSKLDEFRSANTELLKAQKGLEGINMEKYNTMLETERKVRDKELIDKGDFETLINERLASTTSDFTAKLNTATTQSADYKNQYEQLVSKHEIEGAALKAFGEHKIRPEAHNAVMSQIKSTFSVDNGVVIGKEGDSILTGDNGNLTISEFVNSQPDFMRVPNSPGNGDGNSNNQPAFNGKSSTDKIQSGLASLMNK